MGVLRSKAVEGSTDERVVKSVRLSGAELQLHNRLGAHGILLSQHREDFRPKPHLVSQTIDKDNFYIRIYILLSFHNGPSQ